jgi:repressor LexA
LTSRQAEILAFIQEYNTSNGFSPSVRDIGQRFGVNPATVHDHLKALERKGHIAKKANLSRSLHVVAPATGHTPSTDKATPASPRRGVPLVGRVAAGVPILAEQNIEEFVALPEGWARDDAFLLRVEGESMRDAHILDRDLVLVRPTQTADNGEIVVALIGEEATVKSFYRSSEGIELRPANPAFQPIRVDAGDTGTLRIVGKVVGVFRV